MEFAEYIESKLRKALDANKKQGKRRDTGLLTDILDTLFWARCHPDRSVYDISNMLPKKYGKIKPDTLEDNLTFLSTVPVEEPFLQKESEYAGVKIYGLDVNTEPIDVIPFKKEGRPRNIYYVNPYYITDYYRRRGGQFYRMGGTIVSDGEKVLSDTEITDSVSGYTFRR